MVLNGKSYANYPHISSAQFVFSANSQHNAFPATVNGKMFIVYDKQEKTKYDYVSAPSLSPDGKTLAYAAKNEKDRKTSLIINDKVIGLYEEVKHPIVFSQNNLHTAYAVKDGKWSLYVDNKKIASGYDDITSISVTNSGKYAFIGTRGDDYSANINGQESASYISMAGLVISPDEKQSIFIARKGSNEVAVINGKEGKASPMFAGGSTPVFSPDSKHLVYKDSSFSADGKSRNFLIVIDGQEIASNGFYYEGFGQGNGMNTGFVFSPDSRYLIYYSLKNKNTIVRNEIDLTGANQPVITNKNNANSSPDIKKITPPPNTTATKATPNHLKGRILLQVESKGEAWYVNPLDAKRYYLELPADAFNIMRSLGLGASDHDIGSFQASKAPSRLAGRILLQVQDKGQAFYVNPLDLKLYYLGRPSDAFYVMRSLGLGITNNDLTTITTNE